MAVAWAISDREDEPVMKVLFQALKNRCPQAVVKTLMSDDGRCLQTIPVCCIQKTLLLIFHSALPPASACATVYPKVQHLLCLWHVERYECVIYDWKCHSLTSEQCISLTVLQRAWRQKLQACVRNGEHRLEMYTCLWLLMTDESESDFWDRLRLFTTYWKRKEPEFVKYFQETYSYRPG